VRNILDTTYEYLANGTEDEQVLVRLPKDAPPGFSP